MMPEEEEVQNALRIVPTDVPPRADSGLGTIQIDPAHADPQKVHYPSVLLLELILTEIRVQFRIQNRQNLRKEAQMMAVLPQAARCSGG
jgi:hypothetical protein